MNDSVEIPDNLLQDYTFVPENNPNNTRRGGVGLFYRNSLPIKIRKDLAFNESIVAELNFGRKKIFFTVIYRSPSFDHNSIEFQTFVSGFKNLHGKLLAANPYAIFFAGDFNAHSQLWWLNGDTTPEGNEIEELFSSSGLKQLISEPTNFTPNKNPTCIDLIATDQPNLVLDSGTRSSLDPYCHHDIVYCKINFRIPPAPPYERKIWHYNRANITAIRRSMSLYPWQVHLNLNHDPNWQVQTFTNTLLNIMSNFVPNEKKKYVNRNPPWITNDLRTLLKRKNRFYKNYKKRGYRDEDKIILDNFRIECHNAVEYAKESYLKKLGENLDDPNTSQKFYWKLINRALNRCRVPKIPPLLVNNQFILDCKEKAKQFNNFFSLQCKIVKNGSVLPPFLFLTDKKIDSIPIDNDDILTLIRKLNPKKASGPDGISSQMLLLCDESIVLPLKIIYDNILNSTVYPGIWKTANVTPVFKKGDKQVVNNYRPISLLPICGKIFEKLIFKNLYLYLSNNDLITENQSGFRPGDSTTNQLLYLVNEIHEAFDNKECLETRAVFLDISKAFDKVWHEGLLFKLRQNGVSGNLLKLFENYLQSRKQRVVLSGTSSDISEIEPEVTQNSVLGPLLFLIQLLINSSI